MRDYHRINGMKMEGGGCTTVTQGRIQITVHCLKLEEQAF